MSRPQLLRRSSEIALSATTAPLFQPALVHRAAPASTAGLEIASQRIVFDPQDGHADASSIADGIPPLHSNIAKQVLSLLFSTLFSINIMT